MAQMKRIVLANRPKADIQDDTFRIESVARPSASNLQDGQILVRVIITGIEPAMRGWMRDARSYLPPVGINEVMRAESVAVVEASRSPRFKKGDLVKCTSGWTEWAVLPAEKGIKKVDPPAGATPSDYLGVFGLPGMTAYFGLFEVGKPKPGDVVVVTGAAGAVGSAACQMAKIAGAKVYGIAGGKEKCEWLMSLGIDGALDYKDPTFRQKYKELPYANIVFENVGGAILDTALTRLAQGARIVLCGVISAYNRPVPIQNYPILIAMRVKVEGFVVFDYAKRYHEAEAQMAKWLSAGQLKRRETRFKGIESCPEALRGLFQGLNTGKMLVEISDLDAPAKL